jgi:hypothetical protein
MHNLEQIIQLAQEVEITDPIDWEHTNLNVSDAYRLMALGLLEHIESVDQDQRETILMAIALKLSVENFILNLKVLKQNV